MEDLKERYYGLVEKLETLHIDAAKIAAKPFVYDADHERRRKQQLEKLYSRTPEQVLRTRFKMILFREMKGRRKRIFLREIFPPNESPLDESIPHEMKGRRKKIFWGEIIPPNE